ncbi:MAG: ribosome silencing factor [Chloroflexi bacterium]|nr:ribosome silencing factor [Chloroflexota bacterium]
MESTDLARKVAEIAADKKASDIVLLDIGRLTTIADYFVICNGNSERQLKAITDDVLEKLKKDDGIAPLHIEGTEGSGWILLDYGSVIVHVFTPTERQYYKLESIWSEAPVVLRIL